MPATWFIGDLHFEHDKVAQIRGFTNADEHDMVLWYQWEKQVHPDDTVWVLGDISRGSSAAEGVALYLLSRLPGHKHLIAGNHDSVSSIHRNGFKKQRQFLEVFESVQEYQRIRVNGQSVLLSHYPYASQGDGPNRGEARYTQWRLPDEGGHLIHAHTHHDHPTSGSVTGRELCVSWDAWRRIVNYGDIAKWLEEA